MKGDGKEKCSHKCTVCTIAIMLENNAASLRSELRTRSHRDNKATQSSYNCRQLSFFQREKKKSSGRQDLNP